MKRSKSNLATMSSNLSEIGDLVDRARRALIIAHRMPDGDTLGSALGLAWALRKRGIEARLSCADPVPGEFRFLPGSEAYAAQRKSDEDAIWAIDCSDLERLGSIYHPGDFASVPVVNIDHHVTNCRFGNINLVAEKGATAELVLEVINYLGIPLDATIAECLLAGVVTDTVGFRTSNTNAESLRAAVTLMEAGASLAKVVDAVFNHRPLVTLRLWGAAMAAAQCEEHILWVEISQDLLHAANADAEAVKGLANFLATFDGAQVAVVMRETENGRVDVSMRSTPDLDVAAVALMLGGGGHSRAAGCLMQGTLPEARERILAAIRQVKEGQAGAR